MHYEVNTYAAFMMDWSSGALSDAERMAANLHIALSSQGSETARVWDALGGIMLEEHAAEDESLRPVDIMGCDRPKGGGHALNRFLDADLKSRNWRRSFWGPKLASAGMKDASLLRMEPGDRAPRHGHKRRDVTVVLEGAFEDEFGMYERGDIAFGEPGRKHTPRAVGSTSCICFVATEPAPRKLLKLFGRDRRTP